MRKTNVVTNKILLLIGITIISISCVNLPKIELPTAVPTFDSSTLISQISVQDSSGWNWNEIPAPTLEPRPQNSPQLIIGLDGRLHLFWDTLGGAEAFIYHSYFQDGLWSEPAPISLTLGTSKLYETPVISPGGVIHILWFNELKLGGSYRLLYAQFDGVNWSEEDEVYTSKKDLNLRGELFVDSQSTIHSVMKAATGINSDLFYLTKTSGGWDVSEPITPKMGMDGLVVWKYKLMQTGQVLFYGKDLNRNLRFAYWENGTTSSVTKTKIQLPIHTDFFVDSTGNYYTYWAGQVPIPGGTTMGAYYQCIDTDLHSWSETVLSGEKTVITKPLVAQTQSASVIAWINRDDTIEFLFPNGCESANVYSLNLPESTTQKQLISLAMSEEPSKLCAMNKQNYNEFKLYCAEIQ